MFPHYKYMDPHTQHVYGVHTTRQYSTDFNKQIVCLSFDKEKGYRSEAGDKYDWKGCLAGEEMGEGVFRK